MARCRSMGYLRALTPAEIRAHDKRVTALYQSRSLARNVAAILMDTKIGDAGDNESTAQVKAEAIVTLLRRRGLIR
jgi:hypothetical protein